MTASTGYNDPGSIYNQGALSWVTGLSDSAAKIIGAINGGNPVPERTTAAQNAQTGNPTKSSDSNKTLWIVGAILAIVAVIYFVRK